MTKLYRSTKDVKLAGICGGLGEEMNIDPNIIRLLVVFAAVVTAVAPAAITYLVGWIILPKGRPPESNENE